MGNKVERIVDLIKEKWIVTNETSNRLYFKYEHMRGTPKFYFNKNTLDVIRIDKSKEFSKEAISVEVKTTINNLIDENITPMNAQDVFSNRNTDEVKELLTKYGGKDDLGE